MRVLDQLAFVTALPPPGAAVVASTPAPVVQGQAVPAVQGLVMPPPPHQVPEPILPVTLPLTPVSQPTTTAPSTMQTRLTLSDLSSIAQVLFTS